MKTYRILITGGAGFIGSHLAYRLLESGHEVSILDSLVPQVHPYQPQKPSYLDPRAKFVRGDVLDSKIISKLITEAEIVVHFAARVGVAQSMYMISDFISNNTLGTANLLENLVQKENSVQKLIVASTMSVYGEGAYQCKNCGIVYPPSRKRSDIIINTSKKIGYHWEPKCPICNGPVHPIPTPENAELNPTTVYAHSKLHQEQLSLLIGKTNGLPVTALRFFGTYGSHQALSNPYTGVCAIFATSLLAGNSPIIYEDGAQSRDLVHVSDVCQAVELSLDNPQSKGEVFNVGTGERVTIIEIANRLQNLLKVRVPNQISNQFRAGDVRHIFADIAKIKNKLGYQPKMMFNQGIEEFVDWIREIQDKKLVNISDRAQEAFNQLKRYNLL